MVNGDVICFDVIKNQILVHNIHLSSDQIDDMNNRKAAFNWSFV